MIQPTVCRVLRLSSVYINVVGTVSCVKVKEGIWDRGSFLFLIPSEIREHLIRSFSLPLGFEDQIKMNLIEMKSELRF